MGCSSNESIKAWLHRQCPEDVIDGAAYVGRDRATGGGDWEIYDAAAVVAAREELEGKG